nr:hypothetical protein [Tanacetum cinerariifolium]
MLRHHLLILSSQLRGDGDCYPGGRGIDDDILLTIKDDILHEKLLNANLLIAKIKALNDNPTPSFDCKTMSSFTSLNSLLEEANTSDNSLPEFETFCFDVKDISSGSTTTHSDISLLEYEVFYDDHVKEISSGSPTTHSNFSFLSSRPMNQDSYNSNSLGFDQPQPPQSPIIYQPPQELSIQEMEDLKQKYLDELQRLSNLEYRDEIKIAELKENF